MPSKCPEIGGGDAGEKLNAEILKAEMTMNADHDGRRKGSTATKRTPRSIPCTSGAEAPQGTPLGKRRRPASGCGFVPEDIGDEMLTPQDCPEIGGGGVKAIEGNRSPSPGGITARLDEYDRRYRREVREAAGGWRLPPWRRLPNLHGVLRYQEVGPSSGKNPPRAPWENSGIAGMGFENSR